MAADLDRLLFQAGQRLTYNGGHVSAAAVAYYALVSLFPLLLLLLSGLGFVFPAGILADRLIRHGADLLPGTGDFLRQSLDELVAHRESLGLTALVTFYWSASGAFNALARSLDLVWDTPVVFDRTAAFAAPVRVSSRVGLMRRLRALAVVAGVGFLLIVSVLATTYLRVAERLEALPRVGPFGPETAKTVLSVAPVAVARALAGDGGRHRALRGGQRRVRLVRHAPEALRLGLRVGHDGDRALGLVLRGGPDRSVWSRGRGGGPGGVETRGRRGVDPTGRGRSDAGPRGRLLAAFRGPVDPDHEPAGTRDRLHHVHQVKSVGAGVEFDHG